MLKQVEETFSSHPFVTPRFLQNYNIQTLFGRFVPHFKVSNLKPERKYISLPDGSKLAADCWWQKDKEKHLTVVVLSGIEGYQKSKPSRFGKGIGDKAYYFGFNVIFLKQRGEADTMRLTKSLYTNYAGLDDLQVAFEQFTKWGLKKMLPVGVSYGGYYCLLTIGRLGKKAKKYLLGAVAISPHVSMLNTWEHIEKNKFYDFWLLYAYKNLVRRRAKIDPPGTWDIKGLKKLKTKREFMEAYKHTFGYPKKDFTLEEYNSKGDVEPFFSHMQVPTLIINSFDDPISPAMPYTKPEVQNNPNIITLLTKHGGHGGFFTTKKLYGDLDGHWAQNRAMEFIRLLESKHNE